MANNNKVSQQRGLSGRDLFSYDPSLFVDDEEAANDKEYEIIVFFLIYLGRRR